MPQDFLPREFQGDCDRFYRRVIRATLDELPLHADVRRGKFASLDEFLDNCEKQTSNLLTHEARRSFALTLSALFERQLRIWARVHFPEKAEARTLAFDPLLTKTAVLHGLDLATASAGDTLRELHSLANAVRHGEGPAVDGLWERTPRFWSHLTNAAAEACKEQGILSEFIQITDNDFVRYIRAVTRFWGLADREPNAIVDGPY
ncbi:MAG: hypothetical protein ABSE69_03145 [Roseiarcus sp.]